MKFGIYPELTKEYIFKRVSQEEIMEKYLGVPVILNELIRAPKLIRAQDDNPTCSFYYNNQGRLRFRDFAGYFWGDCFDVVGKAISVDSNDKRGFKMILHTIAKDFKIHKYENDTEIKNYHSITSKHFRKIKQKEKTRFRIVPREFNYHDKHYWSKFNITPKLLSIGKVYMAQEIRISTNAGEDYSYIYNYSPKDPAYCYYGGKDINGIDEWKIYYPFRKKGQDRFHSNSSFLQGKHLIDCGRFCVITKSYKDVLVFYSFGISSVAPSAESILLAKSDYDWLINRFDYLVSCMDYDRTGMRMAQQLRKVYKIEPIMLTNGLFGTKDYGAKDIAEYVDNFGSKDTLNLLQSVYSYYKPYILQNEKDLFNYLKFLK